MTWLKSLGQRDLRAIIALLFSILGTVALTGLVVWAIWIFWKGGWPVGTELARIDKIGLIAVLVTVIMGISMAGLQLAISPRQLKGSAFGASFEASGGDDDDDVSKAATAVAGAAAVKAAEIKQDVKDEPTGPRPGGAV